MVNDSRRKPKIKLGKLSFTCPECGHVNTYHHSSPIYGKIEVIYCDIEDGGCNKQMVVKTTVQVTGKVEAFKIQNLNKDT